MHVAIVCDSLGSTPEWVVRELRNAGTTAVVRPCANDADIVACAADADIVWLIGSGPHFTADALPGLQRCRHIVRSGSGTDNIPVEAATARGILVYNTPEATALPVAEATVTLILAAWRELIWHDHATRAGRWTQFEHTPPSLLADATIGLIGFGQIGRIVARLLRALVLRVHAYDPGVPAETMLEHRAKPTEFDNLLEQSDVVSLHCPLVNETRQLIDASALRRMKPSAILVNTSRGPVVDETALVHALRIGAIRGAALDVYEHEPISTENPLSKLDNVLLMPHNAAHTAQTADIFRRCGLSVIAQIARGRIPDSCVNNSD